ncbi:MAG: hypothetical protein JSR19_03920 [Proteobacteria bacterium]|nr:hypothetical protein [Pseudomonadota bacterium]HQR04616.1 hypothetical protein [Rhodocyclaceae bacterium]
MKTLRVTLEAEITIPDQWELVEHPSGIRVLRIGDHYVDFELIPLATTSDADDAEWSDHDAEVVNDILDRIEGVDVYWEIEQTH